MRGWCKALVTSAEVAASVAGAIPMAQPALPSKGWHQGSGAEGGFSVSPPVLGKSPKCSTAYLHGWALCVAAPASKTGPRLWGGEGSTPSCVVGSLACTEMWPLTWRSPPGSLPGICPLMCDPDNCLVSRVQRIAHHIGRDFNWLAFPRLFLPPRSRERLQLRGGTPGTRWLGYI